MKKRFVKLRAVSKLSTFFIHSSPKEIRKVKEGAPKKLNYYYYYYYYLKIFKNGSPSGHIGTCFSRSRLQTT